jgi:hypothetical protein
VLLVDGKADALKLRGHVAPRSLAVIRQDKEGRTRITQLLDELRSPGDGPVSAAKHAIHVDQEALPPAAGSFVLSRSRS